jgi:lipoprotein-releasing system ATP-binding protein
MIEAVHITKSFGQVSVLKDIELHISKGQVVSIVGASGAGKTTLLQILGTLLKPDSGDVIIDGINISKLTANETARFRNQKIGFVFQFHNLLPEFTAIENVAIPAMIARGDKKQIYKEAQKLLEKLNLGHRLHHRPSELSGGEQQRVAVARALINNPAVIFADEPSGNLDSAHKAELHQLFFFLRDEFKQTFVIVTHDKELAYLSDRIIEMKDGLLVN